jgi:hypothetical protein
MQKVELAQEVTRCGVCPGYVKDDPIEVQSDGENAAALARYDPDETYNRPDAPSIPPRHTTARHRTKRRTILPP